MDPFICPNDTALDCTGIESTDETAVCWFDYDPYPCLTAEDMVVALQAEIDHIDSTMY